MTWALKRGRADPPAGAGCHTAEGGLAAPWRLQLLVSPADRGSLHASRRTAGSCSGGAGGSGVAAGPNAHKCQQLDEAHAGGAV